MSPPFSSFFFATVFIALGGTSNLIMNRSVHQVLQAFPLPTGGSKVTLSSSRKRLRTDDHVSKMLSSTDMFHPSDLEIFHLVHHMLSCGTLRVSFQGCMSQVVDCGKDGTLTLDNGVVVSVPSAVNCIFFFCVANTDRYRVIATHYHPTSEVFAHAPASNRSVCFATKTIEILQSLPKLHKKQALVVTLDARLRNCVALTDTGIEAHRVVVVEKNPVVALYQMLLIHMLYSGGTSQHPRVVCSDIVDFLEADPAYVTALYLDLCGLIPSRMKSVLGIMPRLQLYAATIGKRRPKQVSSEWCTELVGPDSFIMGQEFLHRSVECQFYFAPTLPHTVVDCSGLPFLPERVVDIEVEADGTEWANVVWHWYPRDKSWSQSLEPIDRFPILVTEYRAAKLLFPTHQDPVRTAALQSTKMHACRY